MGEVRQKFEVSMENDVNIFTTPPREQAGMLLETLRAEYTDQFNAHWYEERFIAVPEHLWHDALIATCGTAQKPPLSEQIVRRHCSARSGTSLARAVTPHWQTLVRG
jgi:hypothetical protein